MDETKISVKLLDDITECPICTESYSDPRSLPCVHTFCLKCIAQWSNDKLSGHSVNCPLCRREFTIPKDGIGELPKNFFITKLLAMKQTQSASLVEGKLCDPCRAGSTIHSQKEVEAKSFCVDCQESFCELCSELHSKMKLTRAHRTTVFGEQHIDTPVTQLPSTLCDKHPTTDVELYCTECHETLCIVCFVTQHNGHKWAEIAKVAAQFRCDIKRNISDLQETAINILSNSLESLQGKRQTCVEHFDELEMEICEKAEDLKAAIERHKQRLLTELKEKRAEKVKEIDNHISEISQNKALLESFVKYSEELLKKGSDSDIARESHNLTLRSTELKQLSDTDNEMVLPESVLSSKIMSGIDSDVIEPLTVTLLDNEFREKILPVAAAMTVKPSKADSRSESSVRPDSKPCPKLTSSVEGDERTVLAVCTIGDLLYLSRSNAAHIEVYRTSTLQHLKNVTVLFAGNYLPGIAACSVNNCIYVSDDRKILVHRLNLPHLISSKETHWSVSCTPFRLSVNRSNNLLVTSSDMQRILEYTTNGLLIREIANGDCLFHAIELSGGTMAVCQSYTVHKVNVQSTDGDGRGVKRYGNTSSLFGLPVGSRPGQADCPLSFVVDSKGFKLVTDKVKNRIIVLNPDLTDERPLLLSPNLKLTKPKALLYDESLGRLYVGEDDGKKRLLVFDNVNLSSLFSQ